MIKIAPLFKKNSTTGSENISGRSLEEREDKKTLITIKRILKWLK